MKKILFCEAIAGLLAASGLIAMSFNQSPVPSLCNQYQNDQRQFFNNLGQFAQKTRPQNAKSMQKTVDLATYQAPENLKKTLDQHADSMADVFSKGHEIYSFPWLPNYFIKKNAKSRIEGLEHSQQTLDKNKEITLIEMPKKFIYYNPISKKEYVIAPAIEDVKQPLTTEQTKQFADFIVKAGWRDAHRANFMIGKNKKIYPIDTEIHTFNQKNKIDQKQAAIEGLSLLTGAVAPGTEAANYLRKRREFESDSLDVAQWFNEELKKENQAL
ncbi:MAG: hypothetical protein WC707_04570 [Candidatus Babeliaceae bacterium]|jgi:hypothetical protein